MFVKAWQATIPRVGMPPNLSPRATRLHARLNRLTQKIAQERQMAVSVLVISLEKAQAMGSVNRWTVERWVDDPEPEIKCTMKLAETKSGKANKAKVKEAKCASK